MGDKALATRRSLASVPRIIWRRLTLTTLYLAAVLGPASAAEHVAASPSHEMGATALLVGLAVYDYAELSPDVMLEARGEVGRIFGKAGVEFLWSQGGLGAPSAPIRLALIILPEQMAVRIDRQGEALGAASGHGTQRGTIAYAFYTRVKRFAAREHRLVASVLGGVIAHEIGHLLLPVGSHSGTGVMRSIWDQTQASQAQQGALAFDATQAERVRRRLRELASPLASN